MVTKYFHFSLGPVQSFIAQARCSRDLWAGSFILSWLAAVAMKAVTMQGGAIVFPVADEDFLMWLEGKGGGRSPVQGKVPHRFTAGVNEGFMPETVVASVSIAWLALADKIYQGDFSAKDINTKTIWDRQTKAYWDMTWVITASPAGSSALDIRKNWRSYLPPEEAGVKCMMMDGWQELSGADRPNTEEFDKFWQDLRNNGGTGIKTDLRNKEHLCAVAFIKRRFPRYFQSVRAVMPHGWELQGWKITAGKPSEAYMAAVHWLEQVLIDAENHPEIAARLWRFHDAAFNLTDGRYNEWDNQIHCIRKRGISNKWKVLDGNVLFATTLENAHIYENQDQAKQVLEELQTLQGLMPGLQPVTPFYAVLMMDGDNLAAQMSHSSRQAAITDGLAAFTAGVPGLVEKHNGFLVYAGGDGVLAILPLEDALPCALAIREKYAGIFAGLSKPSADESNVFTSISAAIEFAHIKMPLMTVLNDAHNLLTKIAKDEYGRDSLAVSVWKPGGRVLQWAMPWEKAIEVNNGTQRLALERVARCFAIDNDDHGQLGNKFLYKIRERFELLNPNKHGDIILDADQAVELAATEYFSSGLCELYPAADKMQHARSLVKPLLKQCRPVYRKSGENSTITWDESKKILDDALLLVRFIAQKGINL